MGALKWDNWYRSEGAKEHMPKKSFAGKNFGSIFWDAMRLVFYDEHNKPGLLYQGKLYPLAQEIRAYIGDQYFGSSYRFTEKDAEEMLKFGNFHYRFPNRLRFEGPDKEDIGKAWGEAVVDGYEIDVGFYDILDTALNGTGLGIPFPRNELGLRLITYFTGAIVLHQIMHNHHFVHPRGLPEWNKGSSYALSLPHVAFLAVLRASPDWAFFAPLVLSRYPLGGYMCCSTQSPPLGPPEARQPYWSWCSECQGMVGWHGVWQSDPFKNSGYGLRNWYDSCPARHNQGHITGESGKYVMTVNIPSDPGQHLWRWCAKCLYLFFSGHGTGKCAFGGEHFSLGSGDYSLMQNVGTFQNNWRWCNKCQGLFFAGHGAGVCPAGGGHDSTGSADYSVPTEG